jgi:hypothetical protein
MSKKIDSVKKEAKTTISPVMKAFEQSKAINSFQTNFKFSNDIGLELLKGSATDEHIEVLKISIDGIRKFLDLIDEKIEEREKK